MTSPAYRINGETASSEAFYAVACDPARSVAVEACAGAGKTWMLVSRILRALMEGCAPQDILAITFTKKAAGEMRQRLQEWLVAFSYASDTELVDALQIRGMGLELARQRCGDLRGLHATLLQLGRQVQVRTFHSWFAALLRGAPLAVLHELGLPAQYELLEDDSEAVAVTMPRFYGVVAADPDLRQDFMDSVAAHGRSQTLKALEKALQKRVEFVLADAKGVVEASVEPVSVAFPPLSSHEDPTQFLLQDPQARAQVLAAASALGRASAPTFSAKGGELEQAVTRGHADGVLAALLTQKDEPRKFSDKLDGIAAVRAAQELAMQVLAAQAQQAAWMHHQRMARLTRALIAEYAALKRGRGWVDMNDVEGAAQRLLGDAELSGWLQQRLDARVRHLLIDEFQDTNPLQWQALYGWLAAYAGAGSGEAPKVFLVGDPKQSIYRFRRAEPQVFRAAQGFVVQGLGGALLSCDHTRRCATGVVEALNSVMLSAQADAQYNGYRDHTTASDEPGAVRELPQIAREGRSEDGTDYEPVWRDSLSKPRVLPEDTASALEARQAADWIAQELASGQLQPQDIMVLARKRERLGWLFDALTERGIPCEQPEKLDLCEAPAVQDVVALLDVLVSNGHNLSLARALKSPLFDLGDAGLAHIARLQRLWTQPAVPSASDPKDTQDEVVTPPSWWTLLQRWLELPVADRPMPMQDGEPDAQLAGALEQAACTLLRYRELVHNLPPHDALAAIYTQGDVLARFAQAVPPSQRLAVLTQLRAVLGHALQMEGGRFLTTYRLVRALKAGGIRTPLMAQAQAVRLLTIHGAKGLEAHTVLLLDTDAKPPNPESMGVLIDWPGEAPAPQRFVFLASEKRAPVCAAGVLAQEQEARALEELNALYVALTRAATRLVVSSSEPYQRGGTTTWYRRIQPLTTLLEAPASGEPRQAVAEAEGFHLLELPVATLPPDASPTQPVNKLRDEALDALARQGLALHRLLQWRPTPGHAFEWGSVHAQAVAREFALSPGQAQDALSSAQAMVQGEAAWVWDASALNHWGNEVELWHQGELFRLDRLVRRQDTGHWWVLDFKSALHPENQSDLREQMQRYRSALQAADPGAVVRLAFINPLGRLIELP